MKPTEPTDPVRVDPLSLARDFLSTFDRLIRMADPADAGPTYRVSPNRFGETLARIHANGLPDVPDEPAQDGMTPELDEAFAEVRRRMDAEPAVPPAADPVPSTEPITLPAPANGSVEPAAKKPRRKPQYTWIASCFPPDPGLTSVELSDFQSESTKPEVARKDAICAFEGVEYIAGDGNAYKAEAGSIVVSRREKPKAPPIDPVVSRQIHDELCPKGAAAKAAVDRLIEMAAPPATPPPVAEAPIERTPADWSDDDLGALRLPTTVLESIAAKSDITTVGELADALDCSDPDEAGQRRLAKAFGITIFDLGDVVTAVAEYRAAAGHPPGVEPVAGDRVDDCDEDDEPASASDYTPDHPWYYMLGGRLLSVDEIEPGEIAPETVAFHTGRLPKDPVKRASRIRQALDQARKDLQRDVDEYLEQCAAWPDGRDEHEREADESCFGDDEETGQPRCNSYHEALSLTHNHVVYGKGLAAAFERMLAEPCDLAPPAAAGDPYPIGDATAETDGAGRQWWRCRKCRGDWHLPTPTKPKCHKAHRPRIDGPIPLDGPIDPDLESMLERESDADAEERPDDPPKVTGADHFPEEAAAEKKARKRESDRRYQEKKRAARQLAKAIGNPVESAGPAPAPSSVREPVIAGPTAPAESFADPPAIMLGDWRSTPIAEMALEPTMLIYAMKLGLGDAGEIDDWIESRPMAPLAFNTQHTLPQMIELFRTAVYGAKGAAYRPAKKAAAAPAADDWRSIETDQLGIGYTTCAILRNRGLTTAGAVYDAMDDAALLPGLSVEQDETVKRIIKSLRRRKAKREPEPDPNENLFVYWGDGKAGKHTNPVYGIRAKTLADAIAYVKTQHPKDVRFDVRPDLDGTIAKRKLTVRDLITKPAPIRKWEVFDRRFTPPVRLGEVAGANSTRALMAAEAEWPNTLSRSIELREKGVRRPAEPIRPANRLALKPDRDPDAELAGFKAEWDADGDEAAERLERRPADKEGVAS